MNSVPDVIAERLAAKLDKSGDCWLWQGAKTTAGYGAIHSRVHGFYSTHRLAYELVHGPVPEGKHVDHTCHNHDDACTGGRCAHRACCNPDHLEAVAKKTNDRRGKSVFGMNYRKTHCLHGHPFDAANTYLVKGGKGRACRRCHADRENARRKHAV